MLYVTNINRYKPIFENLQQLLKCFPITKFIFYSVNSALRLTRRMSYFINCLIYKTDLNQTLLYCKNKSNTNCLLCLMTLLQHIDLLIICYCMSHIWQYLTHSQNGTHIFTLGEGGGGEANYKHVHIHWRFRHAHHNKVDQFSSIRSWGFSITG